jgi:hypothetical protein
MRRSTGKVLRSRGIQPKDISKVPARRLPVAEVPKTAASLTA